MSLPTKLKFEYGSEKAEKFAQKRKGDPAYLGECEVGGIKIQVCLFTVERGYGHRPPGNNGYEGFKHDVISQKPDLQNPHADYLYEFLFFPPKGMKSSVAEAVTSGVNAKLEQAIKNPAFVTHNSDMYLDMKNFEGFSGNALFYHDERYGKPNAERSFVTPENIKQILSDLAKDSAETYHGHDIREENKALVKRMDGFVKHTVEPRAAEMLPVMTAALKKIKPESSALIEGAAFQDQIRTALIEALTELKLEERGEQKTR